MADQRQQQRLHDSAAGSLTFAGTRFPAVLIIVIAITGQFGDAVSHAQSLSDSQTGTSDLDGGVQISVGQRRRSQARPQAVSGAATASSEGESEVAVVDHSNAVLRLIDSDAAPQPFWSGPIPRTPAVIDDATLNDLFCIGNTCWAVGERGVVLRSDDRGNTWSASVVPYECSLRSLCFVTDKVGWIAGTHGSSVGRKAQAMLLHTRDGGVTWTDLVMTASPARNSAELVSDTTACSVTDLPAIRKIAFFGLQQGFAVVQPTEKFGRASLFRTDNGGATWAPVRSDGNEPVWTTGAFLSETEGIVAGEGLAHATVVDNRSVVIAPPVPTLRRIRGVSARPDGSAWMTGDGAFLLKSGNAGITWASMTLDLPGRPDQLIDFHTVSHRGDIVLAAGTPATAILRSEDSGLSWTAIPTSASGSPISGAIHQIAINTDLSAMAVGSFGTILKSEDAGKSWNVVRSAGYRSGLLNLVTDPDRASWSVLAGESADSGVRATVAQISPQLPSSLSSTPSAALLSSQQALTQIGGNEVTSEWMFSRNRPEHHRSANQLIGDWNRQTDGDLRRILPMRIARLIRIWRPAVIVVESRSDDDGVASVTREVLPSAMRLAATDSNADALRPLFLEPWSVDRVIVRCPSDQTTALAFRSTDFLPNCATTSGLITSYVLRFFEQTDTVNQGYSRVASASDRDCYKVLVQSDSDSNAGASDSVTGQSLFAGLSGGAGPGGVRVVDRRSREEIAALRQTAQAAQIESAAVEGHLRTATTENSLTAELQRIGTNLPPALALQQLRDLVELHQRSDNIEGLLAALQEITRRFPGSDDARASAEALFVYYSSAEIRRYRLDRIEQRRSSTTGLSATGEFGLPTETSDVGPKIPQPDIQKANAVGFRDSSADVTATLLQNWDVHAGQAMSLLTSGQDPGISSRLVLCQAASLRQLNRTGDQSTLLAELARRGGVEAIYAQAESQVGYGAATPALPVTNLRKAGSRPFLDANLNDPCWEQADEIFLKVDDRRGNHAPSESGSRTLIMLSWDDEFLFVAGRVPYLNTGFPKPPLAIDRDHDATHGDRDRVEFELDTDRDYATTFAFSIDQTGQTSERCWTLQNWNPDWFAASADDNESWRFELAIPLKHLDLKQTTAGDLWGIRLRRIAPGFVEQSLTGNSVSNAVSTADSASTAAASETGGRGLIRFIRTQKK